MSALYTYDDAGRPISMYQPLSDKRYSFHHNQHGDVVALTDGSQNVVATYSYDPRGNMISEWYLAEKIHNPFRYGGAFGYYYDEESNLYYLKARYYRPDIYRFISKDPVMGDLTNPMSLNPYAYCEDDPVNTVDPEGLWRLKLGAQSFIDIKLMSATKVGDFKRITYRIWLRITRGGFAINAPLLIIGGSGQVVAWSLRAAKVAFAGQLAWTAANMARSATWRFSTTRAVEGSKSVGWTTVLFEIKKYVSHYTTYENYGS